jgi:CDGSH-type Zn-finger protein
MSNVFIIRANGPLIARGKIRLETSDGKLLEESDEVYLCRCGKSQNKPFCDGSHKTHGFIDPGTFADDKMEAIEGADDVTITLRNNAMLIAKGPMTIQTEDGASRTTRNKAAFCRCGESANKPFCDASHKRCSFNSND